MDLEDGKTAPRDATCYHYGINLPFGDGQGDVAALLRHVANSIDDLAAYGPVDIAGLMYSNNEVNEHGEWPSMTVFYRLD